MHKIYYTLPIYQPAEVIKWSGRLSWTHRSVFGEYYAKKGSQKREVVTNHRGIIVPRVQLNPCIKKITKSLKQDKIDFILNYNWSEGLAIIHN